MNTPQISVIMATYNESPVLIKKAIGSILNQTYSDFELLLIDDSTNLETIKTIDELAKGDARIRIIRTEKKMGFVAALNIGLKQAKGKFIARMDGDDISLPERFERQILFFEQNPNISILGGSMDIIDNDDNVISHRDYATTPFKLKLFALARNPLAHPTIMINKANLNGELYYDENFSKAEDLELWLRIMKNGYKISNVPDTLIRFRVVGNLADKRAGENFEYNYKARKKNFSWRFPFWSLSSIIISKIYTLLPKKIINKAYNIENNA